MATTKTSQINVGPTVGTSQTGAITRVDSPHVPADRTPGSTGFPVDMSDASLLAPTEPHEEFTSLTDNSLRVMEQLRHHANQLATHLQKQQKDLDDREARLNAHVASNESDARADRLNLREWEKQLQQLERSLAQRENTIRTKEASQATRAADKAKTTSSLTTSSDKASEKTSQQSSALTHETPAAGDVPTVPGKSAKAASATKQGAKQADTDKPSDQTESIFQVSRQKQESLANERREKATLELVKKKEKLVQRAEQLERRRADLDDLRREVTQLHKDTLEMRLATEELWVRISGRMPPSAMTRALAELRSKLSDHYRLAAAHLAQQKSELELLSNNIHEKYQTLDEHRRNLQEWFHRRNQDIEEQAARLVRREQELDRQETLLREIHTRSQPEPADQTDKKSAPKKKTDAAATSKSSKSSSRQVA